MTEFSRSELLLGEKAKKIYNSSIIIFGVGGVGSYTAEAIARSGVGRIALVDNDTVSITNINRQLIALHSTIGKQKVDIMKERILNINLSAKVEAFPIFYNSDTAGHIDLSQYDYIVDAIDSVSSKLLLIERAKNLNIPIISAMGAGNKFDPLKFVVTDIFKTSTCPLAKVMRHELRKRGIQSLKVVYSTEPAAIPLPSDENSGKRQTPGSLPYVPSTCGLIIASEVIGDLIIVD